MVSELNKQLEFYINGVGILIVGSLGLVGNVTSIFFFACRRMNMNPTFTHLLVWLAVIDSLFLVLVVLVFSLPALSLTYKQWVFPYILPSLLPVTSVTLTASVYTVVGLSIERYLSLYRPQWSNKGSFLGYILPVLVFAICYNFPKFFEFTTEVSSGGNREPYPQATEFRKDADYGLYVLGANCLLMGIIPFSILIFLSVKISRQLNNQYIQSEMRESAMISLLTSIVIVQLSCHAPRTGINMFEMLMAFTGKSFQLEQTWLVDLSHLLLVISSSCNVIIYVFQDLRFRNLLKSDLKRCLQIYRSSTFRPYQPPLDSVPSSLASLRSSQTETVIFGAAKLQTSSG